MKGRLGLGIKPNLTNWSLTDKSGKLVMINNDSEHFDPFSHIDVRRLAAPWSSSNPRW